jgi:hypothetical protein
LGKEPKNKLKGTPTIKKASSAMDKKVKDPCPKSQQAKKVKEVQLAQLRVV